MRPRQDARPAIAVLATAIAALVALNWHIFGSVVDTSPIGPAAGDAKAGPQRGSELATPLDKKSAAQFHEMVSRPLFNSSRRPVKRDVAAANDTDAEPSELRLIGMMKSGDQAPRALIRFANTQTGKWIAEGEQFNGWTLRKINAGSVVVEAGGRSHELTLSTARRASDDPPSPGSSTKRR
jgi:hypothetical protein